MQIIALPRGGGKTTALAKMMLDDPGLLFVAPTHRQAKSLGHATAQALLPLGATIDRDRFIRVPDDPTTLKGKRIVIDELDGVIGAFLGGATVVAAALTPDNLKGL